MTGNIGITSSLVRRISSYSIEIKYMIQELCKCKLTRQSFDGTDTTETVT